MFFWFARFVMMVGMRILYRVRINGLENIPKEGPFILCANHIHALDPVMLAVASKRRLYTMAKKELFGNRISALFFRKLGAFPVDRDASDMKAYRRALEILKNGQGLLIFSQGHRMKEFENFKNGAALFGLKTGAPLVPAGIRGSYRFFSVINIAVGEALSMETYKEKKVKSEIIGDVMEKVINRIAALSK